MALDMTTGQANELLDALDATYNSGTLRLLSGAMPASSELAESGTALVDITLPADAFGAAASRTKAKAGTWSGTGLSGAGAGTNAGYFRLKTSAGTTGASTSERRIQGTVGTAGATIAISGTPTVAGRVATITSGSAHGLVAGDMVEVLGNATTALNKKYLVLRAPSTTTIEVLLDANVTPGAGGTVNKTFDLTLDNVNIASGQTVTISAASLSL